MNIKQIAYGVLLMAIASVVTLSCTKPQSDIYPELEAYPISFEPDASLIRSDSLESKAGAGSNVITGSELYRFGVYANYADNNIDHGPSVFSTDDAHEVRKEGAKWVYNNVKYWQLGKYYHFRAYHPFSGPDFTLENELSNCDNIEIEYHAGALVQSDLLFAFKTVIADASTVKKKVHLEFKHALAALDFRIKLDDSFADDHTEKITSFYLKGMHPTATVKYHALDPLDPHGASAIFWTIPDYFESEDHFFAWEADVLAGVPQGKSFGNASYNNAHSSTQAVKIFDSSADGSQDGMVFTIPQEVSSTKTHIYFTIESSGSKLYEIPLPNDSWEIGKQYAYTITLLGSSAHIDLSIKDWDYIQAAHNIYL